ncbi:hypothetical protein HHL22_13555 [Hymenobacter sp. RP-2-7]|uniref:Uncharacterized protein n=1 Tax=Hymenobacter polaris TaxID=2682546 RepID=A0A7Y0AF66_9BACT|nr:hypothetical protein [Hymenobacter polaris]NML66233.1 hypothetical protein [Hymenobacter polaris]
MRNKYSFLLALGMAATSLSSCSRANYVFNPTAAPYLGTAQPAQATAPTVAIATSAPAAPLAVRALALAGTAPKRTEAKVSVVAKPSLSQRILLKQVAKHLAKVQSKQQNTVRVEQAAASKAGRAGLIALAGLVVLLIGGLTGVGILATIGAIAFLVGLILLIVHLVSGD